MKNKERKEDKMREEKLLVMAINSYLNRFDPNVERRSRQRVGRYINSSRWVIIMEKRIPNSKGLPVNISRGPPPCWFSKYNVHICISRWPLSPFEDEDQICCQDSHRVIEQDEPNEDPYIVASLRITEVVLFDLWGISIVSGV